MILFEKEINNIFKKINLKKGDIIFLVSDITKLIIYFKKIKIYFDINLFLNILIKTIGKTGTLALPTYNWDFCEGKDFNYYKTKSMTGSLGSAALKRKDFVRTRHPIYSFAITGSETKKILKLKHKSCFGEDSPFAFFYKKNAKYLSIGVDYKSLGFTPVHYVEEKVGVNYRYFKRFRGNFVDEKGKKKKIECKFFVKDLSKISMTGIREETDKKLLSINAISKHFICDNNFNVIQLKPALNLLIKNLKDKSKKKKLIFPLKNNNIKRSKINELNAYQ